MRSDDTDSEAKSDGRIRRMVARLRRGDPSRRVPDVDDADLEVVVRCDDDVTASSAVLDRAGFGESRGAVLRHLLAVPGEAAPGAASSAAREGYQETTLLDGDPDAPDGMVLIALARVQAVDARTVSQERSRMASRASRAGGRSVGWAVLDLPG
ncbi:hypothetical protein [Gordonia zhaorongruii]|uniref:hypothetical protein n=1 Tax=Gordonia zhaorongruii TaxID=2597659 RepID=UPI0010478C89|nr:hypothetical protein [Gordonia zhaorongruii]